MWLAFLVKRNVDAVLAAHISFFAYLIESNSKLTNDCIIEPLQLPSILKGVELEKKVKVR